jgi:hypothetical protein
VVPEISNVRARKRPVTIATKIMSKALDVFMLKNPEVSQGNSSNKASIYKKLLYERCKSFNYLIYLLVPL